MSKSNVVHLTEKELAAILLDVKTVHGMPMFASVLQATKPKCTVKSRTTGLKNPYTEILKYSYVSILLNSDYEKAVTNQLARENKDASEYEKGKNTMPLEFGDNNQFIGTFNNEFVLQYRPNDNIIPQTFYVADGERKDKADLAEYLPVERPATNQGTDREIFWRKLYLKNVIELKFNGVTYKLLR